MCRKIVVTWEPNLVHLEPQRFEGYSLVVIEWLLSYQILFFLKKTEKFFLNFIVIYSQDFEKGYIKAIFFWKKYIAFFIEK